MKRYKKNLLVLIVIFLFLPAVNSFAMIGLSLYPLIDFNDSGIGDGWTFGFGVYWDDSEYWLEMQSTSVSTGTDESGEKMYQNDMRFNFTYHREFSLKSGSDRFIPFYELTAGYATISYENYEYDNYLLIMGGVGCDLYKWVRVKCNPYILGFSHVGAQFSAMIVF